FSRDWSSDVCSSDLIGKRLAVGRAGRRHLRRIEAALAKRCGAGEELAIENRITRRVTEAERNPWVEREEPVGPDIGIAPQVLVPVTIALEACLTGVNRGGD